MKYLSKITYYGYICSNFIIAFIFLYHFFTSDDVNAKGFMLCLTIVLISIIIISFPYVRKEYQEEMEEYCKTRCKEDG